MDVSFKDIERQNQPSSWEGIKNCLFRLQIIVLWASRDLEKYESFSVHDKKIQSLAIEIYKFLHNLSPCITNNIFKANQTVLYDLRKWNVLQSRNPSSLRYGTETISCIAPKIWSLVLKTIKNPDNLKSFKQEIRKWKHDCPCRFDVGYRR